MKPQSVWCRWSCNCCQWWTGTSMSRLKITMKLSINSMLKYKNTKLIKLINRPRQTLLMTMIWATKRSKSHSEACKTLQHPRRSTKYNAQYYPNSLRLLSKPQKQASLFVLTTSLLTSVVNSSMKTFEFVRKIIKSIIFKSNPYRQKILTMGHSHVNIQL
jgi:hypothetical protein